jgi:hypothetical protein
VPPDAKTHREDFVAYVLDRAAPWHRQHMGRLYRQWIDWNDHHFGGALVAPYLLLTETACPRRYGDYSKTSGWGGYGQTRVREKLLTGAHPHVREGDQYAEGRYLFVADVFLHETVHQWQHEVKGNLEPGYKGHGPLFAGRCNEIGAALGLPPVRPAKARGKDKDLPSCAQWPSNVRPEGYYMGAYLPPGEDEGEDEDEAVPAPVVRHIGIDPGAAGGLAVLLPEPPYAIAVPMPVTGRDVSDWLRDHATGATAMIEKVGGYIGVGGKNVGPGPAMFKFGFSAGFAQGCLTALGIPHEEVAPKRWQQVLGVPARKPAESKAQWKARLRGEAQRRFPDVKVTLATADALLIALYCRRVAGVPAGAPTGAPGNGP